MDTEIVVLNLRGTIFYTDSRKFKIFPDSRLANLSVGDHNYNVSKQEYFFDRNPALFNFVLDAYSDGDFHIPKSICSQVVRRELHYWKLDIRLIGKCCIRAFYSDDDDIRIQNEIESTLIKLFRKDLLPVLQTETTETGNGCRETNGQDTLKGEQRTRTKRQRILELLVNPMATKASKIYYVIILITILVSIAIFIMGTFEACRQKRIPEVEVPANITNPKLLMYLTTSPHVLLSILDVLMNTVLLCDFVIVVYAIPDRVLILRHWYFILDMISIASAYFHQILELFDFSRGNIEMTQSVTIVMAFVCCFRVVRIIRLMSHTSSWVALYMTLISNIADICFFLCGFFAVCLMSAALIYLCELMSPDLFGNVLVSFWWAVVTMSSVGYGDVVPKSVIGQMVSIFLISIGLYLVAVPFCIITNSYENYYSNFRFMTKQRRGDNNQIPNDNRISESINTEA